MRVLGEALPARLPVLALSDLVLFPGTRLSVFVGSSEGIAAIDAAWTGARSLIVVSTSGGAHQARQAGVVATVLQCTRSEGARQVELWGRRRIICDLDAGGSLAFFSSFPELIAGTQETESLARLIAERWRELAAFRSLDTAPRLRAAELIDWAAARMNVSCEDGWRLLRMENTVVRGQALLALLESEIETARVDARLKREASQHVRQVSRHELLRKHLQWLEGQLSDSEDAPLRERLAAAPLPSEVRRSCRMALQRLHGNFDQALAARSYLEFIARFPWELPPEASRPTPNWKLFDDTVWGGAALRERMADLIHHGNRPSPVCFAGPPGVGKGYMARRIASCLGLPFAAISLGGVRGDTVLRGLPPGTPGAAPGAVVAALCRAGARRALVLLDDIDKVDDPEGSVWAALLELLDASGRGGFVDRYLGHQIDLQHTWFVATANEPGPLPSALRDRLTVIWLRGYDDREKRAILTRRLWPEAAHAVGRDAATLDRGAVNTLLAATTDEVGVRELERASNRLARRWARTAVPAATIVGSRAARQVFDRKIENLPADAAGRVFGLAWTPVGGTVMPIEVVVLPGGGGVRITGRVGEIMGESIQAAYTWLRVNSESLGIPEEVAGRGLHVHFPEAATPKDGASAGLTLLAGMLSALLGQVLLPRTAFTGEITVLGEVLPVGGIREKLLAALRAGIKTVYLPERNRHDAALLAASDRRRLSVRFISHLDEFLAVLSGPPV